MGVALTILTASMTGTAELVAQDIAAWLGRRGHTITVLPMDALDESAFDRPGAFLICSSTYGQGDVPDNAMAFYDRLGTARPDLCHVVYGVFALGDRTYTDTFCNGGRRFDALLTQLGARRLGEIHRHDASAGTVAEDEGIAWAEAWVEEYVAVASVLS